MQIYMGKSFKNVDFATKLACFGGFIRTKSKKRGRKIRNRRVLDQRLTKTQINPAANQ